MKRVVAAALLILMVCGLCACKKAGKKPPVELNDPSLNQGQVGDEDMDGVIVKIRDGSQLSDQELEEIRNWQQCPIEQGLYILLYEETDIASRYEIPEVLDGYWIAEDYHNDAEDLYNTEAITTRKTYNFALFIYDNEQKTLYQISYNNEE